MDPHSFYAGPDPAVFFLLMRILIRSGYWNLDPDSGWPKSEKKIKLDEFYRVGKKLKITERI